MKINNLKNIEKIYGKDFKERRGSIKHYLLKMQPKHKNLKNLLAKDSKK